jgi:dTDP-4-amino-4,6-dideoxygalactose transaminase
MVSFHRTKNVSSDEGGAVILNNESILQRLDIIYENGTDRRAFTRWEVPFYSWQETGINAGMSNISAAILCAQLGKLEEITRRQLKIFYAYMKHLTPLAKKHGLRLPKIPVYNSNNAHIFYVIFKDEAQRDKVKAHLAQKEIDAVIHYVPLHISPMGEKLGYAPDDLPNTLAVFSRMLRLPMHARLIVDDCETIARGIGEAL